MIGSIVNILESGLGCMGVRACRRDGMSRGLLHSMLDLVRVKHGCVRPLVGGPEVPERCCG